MSCKMTSYDPWNGIEILSCLSFWFLSMYMFVVISLFRHRLKNKSDVTLVVNMGCINSLVLGCVDYILREINGKIVYVYARCTVLVHIKNGMAKHSKLHAKKGICKIYTSKFYHLNLNFIVIWDFVKK